jgi:Mg2+/Co2+ transporter CorC
LLPTAADAAATPVLTLPRIVRVRDLLDTLRSCAHNGFPVQSSTGTFMGVMLRADLLHVLKEGRSLQVQM